jgi:hypothetical protein
MLFYYIYVHRMAVHVLLRLRTCIRFDIICERAVLVTRINCIVFRSGCFEALPAIRFVLDSDKLPEPFWDNISRINNKQKLEAGTKYLVSGYSHGYSST